MSRKIDRRVWAAGGALAAVSLGAIAAQRRHMRRIARDPESATLRGPPIGASSVARSIDGTQLHIETFGPADGQTVLLIHGWTEAIHYWTYLIRELAGRGFRVVAYDLRGHGGSEPAAGGDYSIARFGDDLEAVLAACLTDGRKAVVVGHSLGAMSIAAWAEHHDVESHASAAALLNTGVGDLIAESLLIPVPALANLVNRTLAVPGFLGARAPLPRFSTPLSHAIIRYVAFGPTATPAQIAFYERMLVACPPDVRAGIGIAMSEMHLAHALPRLTVPTLVMAGAADKLTPPAHAERIAQALPALHRMVVLPDTGHMGPLERPAAVSDAVAELALAVQAGSGVMAALPSRSG